MNLADMIRALGGGEPDRRPVDYLAGAGGGLATMGAGMGVGALLARDARRNEPALVSLESAAPGLVDTIRGKFNVLPDDHSWFAPDSGDVRWRQGSDIGELAHEIAHAQGAKSNVRHTLQKLYSPHAMMAAGPLLAIGAGLSGNEDLERAAPFLGIAPALPLLAEEGAAAVSSTRALTRAAKNVEIGDALRRKAIRAMQRKSTHGFLGYLLPALGIAGAGYAAPRVADWAAEEF
jgi:hypothetical protein